jgi:transcriptional regulator with XRE-family HTH domain
MYPNLKLQLWKSGMRQNQLAKVLGMDETVLSKIVNGFRHPSLQVRRRIADVLEIDEQWLFETIDRPGAKERPTNGLAANRANAASAK